MSRRLTENEIRLWAEYTKADTRLGGARLSEFSSLRGGEADAAISHDVALSGEITSPAARNDKHFVQGRSVGAQPPLTLGDHANIDGNTVSRFRRGKLPIEATLDLHGMTQEVAQAAFRAFIHQSRARGLRVARIITGYGKARVSGKEPGEGVLRQALPRWLNYPEIRPLILLADQARAEDGGKGAFLLLLRREREG